MSQLVEIVHRASTNPATPWVLFHNGTVVYLPRPEDDLADQATRLLAEWGPVSAGGPAGDFGVTSMSSGEGWIVSCHHDDIFTFLGGHEVPKGTPDVQIGLLGREKRDQDGSELGVAHIYPGNGLAPVSQSCTLAQAYRESCWENPSEIQPGARLERFGQAVDALANPSAEVKTALAHAASRDAGCLAVLLRPTPEALDALWAAIDDDQTFQNRLLAVAACVDAGAVAKARKRILLLGRDQQGTIGERTSCLLELIHQDPEYREWVRTRGPDFPTLCQLEWMENGRWKRRDMVESWRQMSETFPELCLAAPEQPADLLRLCWPKRWRGPFPSQAMRALLVQGDINPLVDYLLGDDDSFFMEADEGGSMMIRKSAVTVFLPAPYDAVFRDRIYGAKWIIGSLGADRWEIRRRGAIYYLDRTPIQSIRAEMVITGIDHDGQMKGAAAAALKASAGRALEEAARAALAQTDRSLGTVVVTEGRGLAFARYVAHVVATPQRTSEWPGWVSKAVPRILEEAHRRKRLWLAFTALGTSGGIPSDRCACLLLDGIETWLKEHPEVSFKICFSLPSEKVYRAFFKEFQRRGLRVLEADLS